MENQSEMVWNELNSFVGTEEQIYIRRRKNELIDSIITCESYTHSNKKAIYSGSQAEGFSLPGSDLDLMVVIENILLSCSDDVSALKSDIILDTNGVKPGFARLFCHKNLRNHNIISSAIIENEKDLELSSLLFRDRVVEHYQEKCPNSVSHGPCSMRVLPSLYEMDNVYCFACKTWPKVASEWSYRSRNNNWPPPSLVTEIVRNGCHVVPIGNPNSQESFMQWRLSFSMAEKQLVHSFNHTQFLCYGLFKLYLKHVINTNPEVKDLICSYFLKTCIFYSIEEEQVVWDKRNFLDCFCICFRKYMKWVRNEYCPNYFIKDNNMFEGKICGDKSRVLHRYLSEIYHEVLYSLWRIPCLSGFNASTICRPVQFGSDLSNAEREMICDLEIIHGFGYCKYSILTFLRVVFEKIQISTNGVDRALLVMYYKKVLVFIVQAWHCHISKSKTNKTSYKEIQGLKSFIVQNCMETDKCTGMLLLATLRYLCGEYKEVVTIAKKVLNMFETFNFYVAVGVARVKDKRTYMDKFCGKNLTLHKKLSSGNFYQSFYLVKYTRFYPSEIEHELFQRESRYCVFINPVVYTYVLLFLSYHHMGSNEERTNILNELNRLTDNMCFESEKPLACSLFHRCIQLL